MSPFLSLSLFFSFSFFLFLSLCLSFPRPLKLCLSLFISFPFLSLLCPGKVHGSLARAGKVKSQTPKVEKQDKKKKPRGRANKRLLYNRRFVNIIVGPGKKKSPNSNS